MIGLLLPLLMNNVLSGAAPPAVVFPAVCFDGVAESPTMSGATDVVTLEGEADSPTFTGRVVSCD